VASASPRKKAVMTSSYRIIGIHGLASSPTVDQDRNWSRNTIIGGGRCRCEMHFCQRVSPRDASYLIMGIKNVL
jgi:hypothetical protein